LLASACGYILPLYAFLVDYGNMLWKNTCMNFEDAIFLIEPKDVLASLREWVRLERQRQKLTQGELAKKSNVPATTISRLERTGLASTDALMRILFALEQIDSLQIFLKERLRLASFPKSLNEDIPVKKVLRVRHK
jgi:DNA-binding XRE family transcriptional regulator